MSAEENVQGRSIGGAQYEVVRKDPTGGVAILANRRGRYELWERVNGYRGEVLVIDGEEYRFGRTWHGAGVTN